MRATLSITAVLLSLLTLTLSPAYGGVTINNSGFTSPPLGSGAGAYEYGNVPGWTLSNLGNTGVAANGSAFGVKNSPTGQAALMQGGDGTLAGAAITQTVTGFTNGEYLITFLAEDRQHASGYGSSQSLMVFMDGNLIDTVTPTSSTGFTSYAIPLVSLSAGSHTIGFAGGGSGGDSTSFVTNVSITPEPTSLAIWGVVIAGGLLVARRRKA